MEKISMFGCPHMLYGIYIRLSPQVFDDGDYIRSKRPPAAASSWSHHSLDPAFTGFDSCKGNRAFADLRYWEEDSISPTTLIFPGTKG